MRSSSQFSKPAFQAPMFVELVDAFMCLTAQVELGEAYALIREFVHQIRLSRSVEAREKIL